VAWRGHPLLRTLWDSFSYSCRHIFWWERWRTRDWATTDARVIEIEPQSLFERDGGSSFLNRDSDFAIEYEVDGRKYVQTPDIESNIRVGGFKVARSPSIPRRFKVRYLRADPSVYGIAHVYSKVVLWAVTALCVPGLYALILG
jgi:hypothetical protein